VDEPGQNGKPGKLSQPRTELALYNLDSDISEKTDVAAQNPDVVAKLTALAEIARDDLGDSLNKRTGRNVRAPGRLPEGSSAK
jgi:arylsulfatase